MRCSPRSLPGFSGSLREISGSLLRFSDSLPRSLLSLWGFFRKPTSPPLPLREGPPLSPSPFPLRVQGMYQPPYSVLKPLRYKVGGPSEVSPAAELRFAVCDRMDTNCLRAADRPISPLQHALMAKKLMEAARPEGAEALSPGQRPGYNGNGQGALNQRSPAHSGKVKGKSFKIHLTQLSQIGKFKKLKPYALQLNIQTIRLLS